MTGADTHEGYVLGTAGHVDHGKSTLVKALTGIDPDRLAEEKARQMTIDLGFAWLTLPNGQQISVVDVPGHERFIKNMLAGVGGIDAALLVIAADEGPMPQTREHLSILDLLGIRYGVVALTKSDLVDEDWLAMVSEDVSQLLAGTILAKAPIVPVSATTGEGLPSLINALEAMCNTASAHTASERPRLPIDRVFTVQGFGTVVTGTLLDGPLHTGQELRVMPANLPVRVRGLQSHGEAVGVAQPGRRVAVNLAQVGVDDLARGDVLALPGDLEPTRRIDVQMRLLSTSPVALEQNDPVDFFVGAVEQIAWVTLLDTERMEPGESGWVQLRFRHPIAVARGDAFIVRRSSPSITTGGGTVIDANPQRHRRFKPEVLAALDTLAAGTPDEIVLQALVQEPVEARTILASPPGGLTASAAEDALLELLDRDEIRLLALSPTPSQAGEGKELHGYLVASSTLERLIMRLTAIIAEFHKTQPRKRGMPREELRSRFSKTARWFDALLESTRVAGAIVDEGTTVRLANFQASVDPALQQAVDGFLRRLIDEPFAPPSPAELGIDAATLGVLIDQGKVVRVAEGVAFDPGAYRTMELGVIELMANEDGITLAQFRDRFQTSRKYAQVFLEHLDERRVTRRVGDNRVPGLATKRNGLN